MSNSLLAACYRNCLNLARQKGLATIAFPAISCGVFGYPPDLAARIALREITAHAWSGLETTICCFGSRILESYRRAEEARDID